MRHTPLVKSNDADDYMYTSSGWRMGASSPLPGPPCELEGNFMTYI